MEILSQPIDLTNTHTIIYHMQDGQIVTLKIDGVRDVVDFGLGDICDTSEIDGTIHFFPRGNA